MLESVLLQNHAYDDQKAKATMTLYQTNFQTVSNKLLHTKLEELESIPSVSSPQAAEGLQPNIALREVAGQEQILIDDTISSANIPSQVCFDVATPEIQQIDPCSPVLNMPAEYCEEMQQSYVDMVKS